jgi:hypothetical protein
VSLASQPSPDGKTGQGGDWLRTPPLYNAKIKRIIKGYWFLLPFEFEHDE